MGVYHHRDFDEEIEEVFPLENELTFSKKKSKNINDIETLFRCHIDSIMAKEISYKLDLISNLNEDDLPEEGTLYLQLKDGEIIYKARNGFKVNKDGKITKTPRIVEGKITKDAIKKLRKNLPDNYFPTKNNLNEFNKIKENILLVTSLQKPKPIRDDNQVKIKIREHLIFKKDDDVVFEGDVNRGPILEAFGFASGTSPCSKIISMLGGYLYEVLKNSNNNYVKSGTYEEIKIIMNLQKEFIKLKSAELELKNDPLKIRKIRNKILKILSKHGYSSLDKISIESNLLSSPLYNIFDKIRIYIKDFDYEKLDITINDQLQQQAEIRDTFAIKLGEGINISDKYEFYTTFNKFLRILKNDTPINRKRLEFSLFKYYLYNIGTWFKETFSIEDNNELQLVLWQDSDDELEKGKLYVEVEDGLIRYKLLSLNKDDTVIKGVIDDYNFNLFSDLQENNLNLISFLKKGDTLKENQLYLELEAAGKIRYKTLVNNKIIEGTLLKEDLNINFPKNNSLEEFNKGRKEIVSATVTNIIKNYDLCLFNKQQLEENKLYLHLEETEQQGDALIKYNLLINNETIEGVILPSDLNINTFPKSNNLKQFNKIKENIVSVISKKSGYIFFKNKNIGHFQIPEKIDLTDNDFKKRLLEITSRNGHTLRNNIKIHDVIDSKIDSKYNSYDIMKSIIDLFKPLLEFYKTFYTGGYFVKEFLTFKRHFIEEDKSLAENTYPSEIDNMLKEVAYKNKQQTYPIISDLTSRAEANSKSVKGHDLQNRNYYDNILIKLLNLPIEVLKDIESNFRGDPHVSLLRLVEIVAITNKIPIPKSLLFSARTLYITSNDPMRNIAILVDLLSLSERIRNIKYRNGTLLNEITHMLDLIYKANGDQILFDELYKKISDYDNNSDYNVLLRSVLWELKDKYKKPGFIGSIFVGIAKTVLPLFRMVATLLIAPFLLNPKKSILFEFKNSIVAIINGIGLLATLITRLIIRPVEFILSTLYLVVHNILTGSSKLTGIIGNLCSFLGDNVFANPLKNLDYRIQMALLLFTLPLSILEVFGKILSYFGSGLRYLSLQQIDFKNYLHNQFDTNILFEIVDIKRYFLHGIEDMVKGATRFINNEHANNINNNNEYEHKIKKLEIKLLKKEEKFLNACEQLYIFIENEKISKDKDKLLREISTFIEDTLLKWPEIPNRGNTYDEKALAEHTEGILEELTLYIRRIGEIIKKQKEPDKFVDKQRKVMCFSKHKDSNKKDIPVLRQKILKDHMGIIEGKLIVDTFNIRLKKIAAKNNTKDKQEFTEDNFKKLVIKKIRYELEKIEKEKNYDRRATESKKTKNNQNKNKKIKKELLNGYSMDENGTFYRRENNSKKELLKIENKLVENSKSIKETVFKVMTNINTTDAPKAGTDEAAVRSVIADAVSKTVRNFANAEVIISDCSIGVALALFKDLQKSGIKNLKIADKIINETKKNGNKKDKKFLEIYRRKITRDSQLHSNLSL